MLDPAKCPKVDAGLVNLLIAMPCYGGTTYVAHNRSLRGLIDQLNFHKVRFQIAETLSESLIPRARNCFGNICCFDKSASGDPFTHILFLDVDIGFNPLNILELIGWDKDIAALPYACKSTNWGYVADAVKRGVEDPVTLSRMGSRPIVNTTGIVDPFDVHAPVQFPQLGTGILLIKRHVFAKMAEDESRRYLLMDGEKFFGPRDWAYDFFQIGINKETRYYDSEDYRFCLDARALGFETWLLPWAVTSHTGATEFWLDIPGQAQYGIPASDASVPVNGFVPLTI
ncbi:MAG: hypothetical protein JWQ87_5467 [Candidatus Sulfotelmatobacter sp.]|nr:hypothetical protein [Candidatus Sulfotelmatobacter sp.]